jgi:hypothetical protein
MNQKHLTLIWQWMSVACLLFLITSIISIQGGSEFAGKLFGDKLGNVADNKPAIGYFGAVIGSVLFLVASVALSLHAHRYGRSWHERVPVLWLEGLNTSSWEGRLFQAVVMILFLALPLMGTKCASVERARATNPANQVSKFFRDSGRHSWFMGCRFLAPAWGWPRSH